MTSEEPRPTAKAVVLALALVLFVVFVAWTVWLVLSFVFGTLIGQVLLAITILAATGYLVLSDDFDPDDALQADHPEGADDE